MYSYNSKNLHYILFFLLLLSLTSVSVNGQTRLTLPEALELAQQNNRSILKSQQAIIIKKATYEQSKGNFLPYIGINVTDVVSNNPLNVFGFKLLHEEVKQEDFNPTLLNAPDVLNHFNLTVNALMPLYNPEAKAQQEATLHQINMQESISQRTVEGIELEVEKAYYMLLLSQNAVDVLQETKQAAQANYNVVSNYFDQGLTLKSDLLEMQIMVNQAEIALQSAKLNQANAQSQFNYIIGNTEEVQYLPIDAMKTPTPLTLNTPVFNNDRADFQAMNHGIQAMESMMKATDKSFIPKIKAFAGIEMNDKIPFAMGANNFQVGVTVGWDIYKGNLRKTTINRTKAGIKEKRLELEDQKASARLEITKVNREITDLHSQIQLHDLSISQAEEALKIRKNRFKQGLEKTSDIINGETQLSHKKLSRIQSLYALNMKHAYLSFLLK